MCLVSGALALEFPLTVMCCPGFPGCFPESRPWVLSLGAVCNTSQSACDELCGQGSARRSMSSACFGCVALSVSLWDSSPHNDSEADMKSCGHSYSVQVSV